MQIKRGWIHVKLENLDREKDQMRLENKRIDEGGSKLEGVFCSHRDIEK